MHYSRSTSKNDLLVSPLITEKRKIEPVSYRAFVGTLVAIPIWVSTILPLTVGYQALRYLGTAFLSKHQEQKVDSGYVPPEGMIIPRPKRKYDVVVLGATGFTGKLAVRHLAKTYGVGGKVSWAIAGRSKEKLNNVLFELADELGKEELRNVDTIVVDTSIPSTLPQLVGNTRSVATTVGPFTLYGSFVVEYCAKFGTHYCDITGEIDWVKNMYLHWHETARKTGAKIVPFCGHDSIPWDSTLMKLREILRTECDDQLAEINFWDQSNDAAPGGTVATIFTTIEGKAMKAPKVVVDPFSRKPNGSPSSHKLEADLPIFISKCKSPWESKNSRRWTMPFIMAPVNAAVAGWSHALHSQGSEKIIYREFLVLSDFKSAFVSYFGLLMFGTMMLNPLTAAVLKNYVFPKSGEGPSLEEMENKHFCCISAEAVGIKGNHVLAHLYFCKNTGCLETSRMLVESALVLSLEEHRHPNKSGGFWTASTGIGDILLQRLLDSGTQFMFQVIHKKKRT